MREKKNWWQEKTKENGDKKGNIMFTEEAIVYEKENISTIKSSINTRKVNFLVNTIEITSILDEGDYNNNIKTKTSYMK